MKLSIFGPKEKVVRGMEERTAGLMKYVFTAPRWKNTIPFTLALSLVVGAGVFNFGWRENLLAGLVLIGMPAVLAAAFTHPLARLLHGTMTINRSALLAFVGAIIISVFCVIGALISFATGWQLTIPAYVMSLRRSFRFQDFGANGRNDEELSPKSSPCFASNDIRGSFLAVIRRYGLRRKPSGYKHRVHAGSASIHAVH